MKKTLMVLALVAASGAAQAQTIYVSRVGDGAAALSNAATAVFVDRFNLNGTSAGAAIPLPTAASGSNLAVTTSGTATSEGQLSLGTIGANSYLVYGGYNAAPGTASVASTQSSATLRSLAAIDLGTLSVDSSTAASDAGNNNIRSAALDAGVFYFGTGNAGVRSTALGSTTTSTQLSGTTVTNYRVVNRVGGTTFATSGSGAALGLNTIDGSGFTNVIATGTGSSPYDFIVRNTSTTAGLIYIADDRTTTAGGLQIWTNTSGTWTLSSTVNIAGQVSGNVGLRSITQDPFTNLIYGITTDNRLVAINPSNGSVGTLAIAATNTAFRGVEIVVPTPGSAALLGIAGLLAARRKR